MIVPFFVTDAAGAIVRTGRCQAEDIADQGGPGLTVREGDADDSRQKWDHGIRGLVPLPADPPPDPAAVLVEKRKRMAITPRQLFLGMVRAGYITSAEGVAAAMNGTMPAVVEAAVAELPPDDELAARITWARMTVVVRNDPMVAIVATAAGMDDAATDAFFADCAGI